MENEKKINRKIKRFTTRLKSKGIQVSEVPQSNIVLCNVGQASNIKKEAILEWVQQYCPQLTLPKYIAEKGETYSYFVFNTTDEAKEFYNTCNTKIPVDNNGTFLYLSYAQNVPNLEILINHQDPSGLRILLNFITPDEEKLLLKLFDWVDTAENGKLKNRQVKHYGYEFRYGSNDVDLHCPLLQKIPEECSIFWSRLKSYGLDVTKPDQLTVNKYYPGQGIPYHVDKHSPFGPIILSLSLGGSVVMDWRHHSGKNVPIFLPERSMLVMQSEARYDWQHGIQPRTYDPVIETRSIPAENGSTTVKVITNETLPRQTRISLTFRWTRSGDCACSYKTLCDSVKQEKTNDIEDKLASHLEQVHVHQVYERIAGHFSNTRFKPWAKVVEFLNRAEAGDLVLDLGCGNGKNILREQQAYQLAGERSSGLLSECQEHIQQIGTADCLRMDLLQTPLRDQIADYVICIAVIHHFSSKARRFQSICTISRLLRAGGRALITVWAKDQTKSNYLCKNKQDKNPNEGSCTTVGGLNLPVHENRTQFQHNDVLVPWKLRPVKGDKLTDKSVDTLLRFYHVFEEGELKQLCDECPTLKVEDTYYDEGNWCVICKKI